MRRPCARRERARASRRPHRAHGRQREFASGNGGFFGELRCLTAPEAARPTTRRKRLPSWTRPTTGWRTRLGYVRTFHPVPPAEERRASGRPRRRGSLQSFAFTAAPESRAIGRPVVLRRLHVDGVRGGERGGSPGEGRPLRALPGAGVRARRSLRSRLSSVAPSPFSPASSGRRPRRPDARLHPRLHARRGQEARRLVARSRRTSAASTPRATACAWTRWERRRRAGPS